MKALSMLVTGGLLLTASTQGLAAETLPANERAWAQAVNLMPLIDPAKDAVKGTWKVEQGALHVQAERHGDAILAIPYEPPEEYDFRIAFTRSGGNSVNQIITQGGRAAVWWMGGWANKVFGFDAVDGNPADKNRTTVSVNSCLEDDRRYTSVLQVRKTEIKAFLDGQLIASWKRKPDYSDGSLPPAWNISTQRQLGLGNHRNTTVFHTIDVLEITGKGHTVAHTQVVVVKPASEADTTGKRTRDRTPAKTSREPAADLADANAWHFMIWKGEIILPAGNFRGPEKGIHLEKDCHVIVSPGTLIKDARFGGGGAKWKIEGSLFRRVELWGDLGERLDAKDSVFEECNFHKGGGWWVSAWSTRWNLENCVISKQFLPSSISVTDYAIRAIDCTFYDLTLPKIGYKEDPSGQAQCNDLRFEHCRFVNCEVPESALAATIACVFDNCKFTTTGQTDWTHASKRVAVNAFITPAKAKLPESHTNGLLEVNFKSASDAQPAGASLKVTRTDTTLTYAAVAEKGAMLQIGDMVSAAEVAAQKPAAAEVADATLQKDARKFARNQSSIRGLCVLQMKNGPRLGGAQDIIATVERSRAGHETTADFAGEVAKDTLISLEEAVRLLKVRYPVWQAGYRIRFSYADKYSKQSGGSAGGAFAVLLVSLLEGLQIDPDFAMTGDVTVDGKIRKVGAVAEKVHGAMLEKCKVVALPAANKDSLSDLVVLYGPNILWQAQLFAVENLDQAAAVARQDRAEPLAQAMTQFAQLQKSLGPQATVTALNSPSTVQALQEVLKLAPNHLSAEFMLLGAHGQLPTKLSLASSLEETWWAAAPLLPSLFTDEGSATKKPDRTSTWHVPEEVYRTMITRLTWLANRIHPKAHDLHTAMTEYVAALSAVNRPGQVSSFARQQCLAKRDKLLGESVKLGADRKVLEELMH
jgi:hypothetical protein